MTELAVAIENLYATFARYPLNLRMYACECCVDPADYCEIFDGELRELEQAQLIQFASQAATTWGDANDYRHFLPRIFEIMATEPPMNIGTEHWLQSGKLNYVHWRRWPKAEQCAIERYRFAWFRNKVCKPPDGEHRGLDNTVDDILVSAASLRIDIGPYLEAWEKSGAVGAIHLAGVIQRFARAGDVLGMWDGNDTARDRFKAWIVSPDRLGQLWAAVPLSSDPAHLEDAILVLEALNSGNE